VTTIASAASLVASETVIGKVAGGGKNISVTLTTSGSTAYTIGDSVGGLITMANATRVNGGHSIINSLTIVGSSALAFTLWLINADLAASSADNAMVTWTAGDTGKFLGTVGIVASDYVAPGSGAFNMATLGGVGRQVKAASSTTSIYGYLTPAANSATGASTLDITVAFEYLD
jgi:hypothetical protein